MNRHVNLKSCTAHPIARGGSRSPWPCDGAMAVRIDGIAVLK